MGTDAVLNCPRCGFDYLHHREVEVFSRSEDAPTVRRVTVVGVTAPGGIVGDCGPVTVEHIPEAGAGNPSGRRDGLVIHFECEGCGTGLMLNIAQHKGSTFMEWSFEEAQESQPDLGLTETQGTA
jgi:hypothetical protein